MKLGIIAYPKEENFKMAAEKGLDFIEYCINAGENADDFFNNLETIKSWIDKYNVKIGSIGRWGQDRIDKSGNIIQEEFDMSCKLIDAASYLGCENFVTGCNYVNELSYFDNCKSAINFFSRLLEYGNRKDVKISTYNCRWNSFVNNDRAWTMIHGHLKQLGIKYDPSHAIYEGADYLKETRDWGDRFNHIHIKGSLVIGGNRFDDPPAGLDNTNWGSFMAILYAKNYDRGLSIEPHSENWKGELGNKGVDFTIKFIRSLMLK